MDPYRTLGLSPGASNAEIKAAYRRLVKAFHPDAAGEKAISRFLAIQAAYDALTGGPNADGRSTGPRESWRADPARARATPGATRPRPGRSGASWQRGESGRTGRADRQGDERPGADREERGSPRASGTFQRADRGGQAPTGGTTRRDRATRRATPGSTSYDSAGEPFNPEWSGASWYGTTSGTYWTLNPKEYADPRKHGPEYQARARRAQSARPDDIDSTEGADDDGGIDAGGLNGDEIDDDVQLGFRRPAPGPSAAFRAAASDGDNASGRTESDGSTTSRGVDVLAAIRAPSGIGGRAAIALLGWPPLGVAFAAFISEASGCGRFAASCVDTFDLGTWAGQLAIIGLLLALPKLASISAIGTLAMLTASVPGAILLSAAGGAQDRDTAATVLGVVLVVAYAVGVVLAVARGTRTLRA
jgi:hypothetical protein